MSRVPRSRRAEVARALEEEERKSLLAVIAAASAAIQQSLSNKPPSVSIQTEQAHEQVKRKEEQQSEHAVTTSEPDSSSADEKTNSSSEQAQRKQTQQTRRPVSTSESGSSSANSNDEKANTSATSCSASDEANNSTSESDDKDFSSVEPDRDQEDHKRKKAPSRSNSDEQGDCKNARHDGASEDREMSATSHSSGTSSDDNWDTKVSASRVSKATKNDPSLGKKKEQERQPQPVVTTSERGSSFGNSDDEKANTSSGSSSDSKQDAESEEEHHKRKNAPSRSDSNEQGNCKNARHDGATEDREMSAASPSSENSSDDNWDTKVSASCDSKAFKNDTSSEDQDMSQPSQPDTSSEENWDSRPSGSGGGSSQDSATSSDGQASDEAYDRRIAARERQRSKYLLEELQETCVALAQRSEELASENDRIREEIDGVQRRRRVLPSVDGDGHPATTPSEDSGFSFSPSTETTGTAREILSMLLQLQQQPDSQTDLNAVLTQILLQAATDDPSTFQSLLETLVSECAA